MKPSIKRSHYANTNGVLHWSVYNRHGYRVWQGLGWDNALRAALMATTKGGAR